MEDLCCFMIIDVLRLAVDESASDVFISVGRKISLKKNGVIAPYNDTVVTAELAEQYVTNLYELANRPIDKFQSTGDDDFPVTIPNLARFRVNAFRQRGTMSAVIRVVKFNLPDYKSLHIPDVVMNVASENNGLVLVTGPAGSGKSTTLACMIDTINKMRNCHVITLEDPIEFLHKDIKSFISQREISTDTQSYMEALRASLRQVPDIILLGEMRDHETIRTAMTAAETGHLVISTLHTVGAANTIDRIIDSFPPQQQQQTRVQLSMVLRMVVSQKLVPNINGESTPVFEIMKVNKAISNLIREGKSHQIDAVIQTSAGEDMVNLDSYILNLFKNGSITKETALTHAANPEQMQRAVGV